MLKIKIRFKTRISNRLVNGLGTKKGLSTLDYLEIKVASNIFNKLNFKLKCLNYFSIMCVPFHR